MESKREDTKHLSHLLPRHKARDRRWARNGKPLQRVSLEAELEWSTNFQSFLPLGINLFRQLSSVPSHILCPVWLLPTRLFWLTPRGTVWLDLFSFSFQVIILQKVNSEEVERHVTHEQLIVGEETDKRMKVNGRQAVPNRHSFQLLPSSGCFSKVTITC